MKYFTLILGILVMTLFYFFKKPAEIKSINNKEQKKTKEDLNNPKKTGEFKKLSKKAYDYLQEQQELAESKYAIGSYESWFYDQDTGLLTFSDGDTIKLRIKYEEVGSISKISKTWLWSWANPHLDEKIKTDILQVKDFGEKQKLEPLTKRKWYGDEYDGWEMTAISAYLLKAKGAYRVPAENTYSFFIFKEIEDLRKK